MRGLNKAARLNYYYRLDEQERLTLELTDSKDIQECIDLTIKCINQIRSRHPRLPNYEDKPSRNYFSPNSNPSKAHRNGFNLAIREVEKLYEFPMLAKAKREGER